MRYLFAAFSILAAVFLAPLAIYLLATLWSIRCTGKKPISEQWSGDRAYKAVLYDEHCPGTYTPTTETYSIRLDAVPGPNQKQGWRLHVGFADDNFDDGPVSMAWPDDHTLAVVVHNAALEGTLTRRVYDMMITMTYEPAPPTVPALPVSGNTTALPAK